MSIRADRLRAARERSGLSQRQLAELCGLGEVQIYRYENNKADPTATTIKVIAEQLHMTSDYLLGLSDVTVGYAAETLRQDERQLLDAYTTGDSLTILELVAARMRALLTDKTPREES